MTHMTPDARREVTIQQFINVYTKRRGVKMPSCFTSFSTKNSDLTPFHVVHMRWRMYISSDKRLATGGMPLLCNKANNLPRWARSNALDASRVHKNTSVCLLLQWEGTSLVIMVHIFVEWYRLYWNCIPLVNSMRSCLSIMRILTALFKAEHKAMLDVITRTCPVVV